MRKYFALCCLIIFGTSLSKTLFAQKSQLLKVDAAFKKEQVAAGIRIESYLKKKNKTGRISYRKDGLMLLLVDVSASGIPIYIKADNAGVATSLNVNELRSGGALGLNLEGDGIEIGIWDEGKIRNDHVELAGRVTQIDNASTLSTHATHVLGTIMATGLNVNAKGMAPKATAIAFDFNNDVSEMTGQATPDQTSIVLSNHSYGTLSGWDNDGGVWTWHGDPNISNEADWKFGFYNSTSKLYDDIAFNAPYYLIVKAAGNDGNDTGTGPQEPDCNPFDCIPTSGVAKNIMTVGAVTKLAGSYTGPGDVVLTSFSSLGPSDDGRIKPDIVAPGQGVTSSSSTTTNAYTVLSGTSMSSPATTGTLTLLQELHKNLNAGNLMKAATLKALAIHTAREAGANNGPDYTHGWGLLDAEAAAKILVDKDDQNIFVEELSINNSEVYELALSPVQNTKITATIVWTDPAGTPQSPSLNPTTRMLVNDLDLRLVDDGGTQQFPWILNPANPSAAATRADNFRDNVEKIEFENPEPRNYKLRVTHKGTLVNGKQDFSLIINYTSLVDPRVSYYWIGDTGNWNDGTKWSLTSGGNPASIVPGVDDKVVFDENSFSGDNKTVSFTQNHECYSMRWFANEPTDLSFNGNTLTVKEGINLLSDNITSSSSGTMSFEGDATINAIINLGNNNLDDLSILFSGAGATWNVMGNVSLNRIELIEGTISIGENSIKVNEIIASGTQAKSVNLIDTDLTAINSLLVNLGSASLQTENFTINIPSTVSPNSLDFGSMPFEGTINLQGGEVDILGDGEIEKIEGQGIVKIFGSHSIGGFELGAGSALQLEQGSTQVFTENLLLSGISGNAIAINSSGPAPAVISFDGHYKICLDHLIVDNVSVEGESAVNAGLNSTVANATNWIQKACGEILFPDFSAENTCVNASVLFQDNSSGPIASRSWNFGDNGSSSNISDLENPIHYYAQQDDYLVTLIVSNGVDTESYTKTIQLQDNTLVENTAELNNGKLISFLPSNQYQWILDNELIAGATSRTINFSGDLGEYAVLTFDEICNRKSAPFVITGIEESILNSNRSVVYPNPTQGRVYVGSPDGSPIVSLQIINGLGQVLSSKMNSTEDELEFDLGGYRAGIYILRIQTARTTYIERVVVR